MARTGNGRKQVISWMDAPDDVYFRATEASKYVLCTSYRFSQKVSIEAFCILKSTL